MTRLLEIAGVAKRFPGVQALDGVTLALDAGEVLGLVGENGAGKSTLVKILAGVHRPDAGRILLAGRPFTPHRPRDALDRGLVVIHQELSLVPDRTVAENIFLGNLPRTPFGLVRRTELARAALATMRRVGLDVAPSARVRRLGIAQQQLVEIARALSRRARVIVMDEPSSALTETELRILLETIRSLKAQGIGVIFISHHLEEVLAICDRVTVMRDARVVASRPIAEWTEESIVQAMVARPIDSFFPKADVTLGAPLLEVEGLASPGRFQDVSFAVRAGEIVGLAGLVGAGRTETLKTIYGALPKSGGTVRVAGRPVTVKSPRQALRAGITLVPEDRKSEGLILPFSVRQNIVLSIIRRLAALRVVNLPGRIDRLAERSVASLRIRLASVRQPVRDLSGGNQQKVVLARVLTLSPRVFMLDEPTRGIDIGAKVEVYRLIAELATSGAAVLIVSSELLELLGLCDRILVMRAGRLTGELARAEFSQERVMALAALG